MHNNMDGMTNTKKRRIQYKILMFGEVILHVLESVVASFNETICLSFLFCQEVLLGQDNYCFRYYCCDLNGHQTCHNVELTYKDMHHQCTSKQALPKALLLQLPKSYLNVFQNREQFPRPERKEATQFFLNS